MDQVLSKAIKSFVEKVENQKVHKKNFVFSCGDYHGVIHHDSRKKFHAKLKIKNSDLGISFRGNSNEIQQSLTKVFINSSKLSFAV